jgi:uncharacterized membrane protein
MKRLTDGQRLWFYRSLTLISTAVLVHLLAVWAVPRLIMLAVKHSPTAQAYNMLNRAAFPPPTTAKLRDIVMPNPDMLYAACLYDVTAGPLRIAAKPALKSYWSIALYAANSDNFFVVNDRVAGDKPVDLWLVSEGGNAQTLGVPPGSQVVVAPSRTGFLLMRVLTGDYESEKAVVEPARRTLTCTPA